MKAIHWVATIAAALVISALWLGLTSANYGGNVTTTGNEYNGVNSTPNPLPASVIPSIPDPVAEASHASGVNWSDPKFNLEHIQTPQDGNLVEAYGIAYEANQLDAYCNLSANPDIASWGWVPDFEWELDGLVGVDPWIGPSSRRYSARCRLTILFHSNLGVWERDDTITTTLEPEDQGWSTLHAYASVTAPTYVNHPANIEFTYVVQMSGWALISRADGIALHSKGENGQNCRGTVVLYDFNNDTALATWNLN